MLYFFREDKTVEAFDDWPDVGDKQFAKGTILYDPADTNMPWTLCQGKYGAVKQTRYEDVPKWVKAYALLID